MAYLVTSAIRKKRTLTVNDKILPLTLLGFCQEQVAKRSIAKQKMVLKSFSIKVPGILNFGTILGVFTDLLLA